MTYQEFKDFKSKIYAILEQLKEEYNKKVAEVEYWKEIAIKYENELNRLRRENEELTKISSIVENYQSYKLLKEEGVQGKQFIRHDGDVIDRIKSSLESIL